MKHVAIMLWLSLLFSDVCAQEGRVRFAVQHQETYWAGQQITLNLDFMTSGQSFANIRFNLPEVPGAFLLQTTTTTVKLTETIDGETWQVLRYPISLFPQQDGRVDVPPLSARFSSVKQFGSPPTDFDLKTETLSLSISWPPEAPGDAMVVTTPEFSLQQQWEPAQPDKLKTGGSVTLSVTQQAQDISGMLLPALPVTEIEGLSAYPDAAQVNDHDERGQLSGVRVDRITWIIEKAGNYKIPAIRFQWWNPEKQQLQEQLISGLSFTALKSPSNSEAHVTVDPTPRYWAWMLVILPLLALLLTWQRQRIHKIFTKVRIHRESNEQFRFKRVRKAALRGDAAETYACVTHWMACLPKQPTSLNAFARLCGNDLLTQESIKLQEAICMQGASVWHGKTFIKALSQVRLDHLHHQSPARSALQQQLNPRT